MRAGTSGATLMSSLLLGSILASSYALLYHLDLYVDLQNAISLHGKQLENLHARPPERSATTDRPSSASEIPDDSALPPELTPEDAYLAVFRAAGGSNAEFLIAYDDPQTSLIPASSEMKLQQAEKWMCPSFGVVFASYLDESMSADVLYGSSEDHEDATEALEEGEKLDQRRADEQVLHVAKKFHARVRIELRWLTTSSEATAVEAAFEKLFTKCIIAPVLEDLATSY